MALTDKLKEGSHHVRMVKANYETVEFDITVTAGQPETYSKSLEPKPGSITVRANVANATATIVETAESCTTTCTFNNISPGTYTIKCEKSGYKTEEKTVTVDPNEDESISFTLEEENISFNLIDAYLDFSPKSVKAGDSIDCDVSYSNNGNVTATPHIEIWLKLDGTTRTLKEYDGASQAPNHQRSEPVNGVPIPSDLSPGSYPLYMQISHSGGSTIYDSVEVGTLTIEEETAQITFESSPSGASIYIDGKNVGTT